MGLFEAAIDMCNAAEARHASGFTLLSDLYYLRGTCYMECNKVDTAIENQLASRRHFVRACNQSEVQLPDVREAATTGILGHGYQCQGLFSRAEDSYRKAISYWYGQALPGTPVIWELGLVLSLTNQAKYDEAEEVVDRILAHRKALYGAFDTISTM